MAWNAPAPTGAATAPGAGFTPAANILPAGVYATQPNGPVSATNGANPFWQKTNTNARGAFNFLWIIGIQGDAADQEIISSAPAGTILLDQAGVPITADCGLPENFGRGRGLWLEEDANYIEAGFSEGLDDDAERMVIDDRGFVAGPDGVHGDIAVRVRMVADVLSDARMYLRFVPDEER